MIVIQKPEPAPPGPDALLEAARGLLAAAQADGDSHSPSDLALLVEGLARKTARRQLHEGAQTRLAEETYYDREESEATIKHIEEAIQHHTDVSASKAQWQALEHRVAQEIQHEIWILGRAIKKVNSWAAAVPFMVLVGAVLGAHVVAGPIASLLTFFLGGAAVNAYNAPKNEKISQEAVEALKNNHVQLSPEAEKIKAHIARLRELMAKITPHT